MRMTLTINKWGCTKLLCRSSCVLVSIPFRSRVCLRLNKLLCRRRPHSDGAHQRLCHWRFWYSLSLFHFLSFSFSPIILCLLLQYCYVIDLLWVVLLLQYSPVAITGGIASTSTTSGSAVITGGTQLLFAYFAHFAHFAHESVRSPMCLSYVCAWDCHCVFCTFVYFSPVSFFCHRNQASA